MGNQCRGLLSSLSSSLLISPSLSLTLCPSLSILPASLSASLPLCPPLCPSCLSLSLSLSLSLRVEPTKPSFVVCNFFERPFLRAREMAAFPSASAPVSRLRNSRRRLGLKKATARNHKNTKPSPHACIGRGCSKRGLEHEAVAVEARHPPACNEGQRKGRTHLAMASSDAVLT